MDMTGYDCANQASMKCHRELYIIALFYPRPYSRRQTKIRQQMRLRAGLVDQEREINSRVGGVTGDD